MSKHLLHLDSSILGSHSVSRSLSAKVAARLVQADPQLEVTYRDLAANPIPHLSGAYVAVSHKGMEAPQNPQLLEDLALGEQVLQEFLAADIVVIGVGFYNFSIPSQLKTWIDRIAIAGKTFQYVEGRPVGLAGNKRVILTISRGGFYGAGSPAHAMEHAETYLRGAFAFMGIKDLEVVAAEGVNAGPEQREAALAQAEQHIAAIDA